MSGQFKENVKKAESYLKRFKDNVTVHHVNGEACRGDSGITFENLTPVDNTPIGAIAEGSAGDIDLACRAARDAFPDWSRSPAKQRRKVLNHFADLVEQRAEEIALVESMDCGQPIRFMRGSRGARRGEFSFLCRQGPASRQRPVIAPG